MAKDFVSVEAPVYLVRYHPTGEGYGSAYSFSVVLTRTGTHGYLSMASGTFTPTAYKAIRRYLMRIGMTHVRFERRNLPRVRHREIDHEGARSADSAGQDQPGDAIEAPDVG